MPATFDGVDEKDLVFCDPQCKKHAKGRVSPRVRRGCIHRIKLATAREKAIARRQASRPSEASASTSAAPQPQPQPLDLDLAGSVNTFLARQSVPPAPPSDLDEQLDTTLPSWGIPPDGDDLFEAEADVNPPMDDANPPTDDEGDAWTEIPPGYDAAMEPDSTDVGYTSGSETDAESDRNMHLDGLEYISPASSPPCPPIAEQRPPSPCNLDDNDQMSEHDSTPDNQNPPPVATAKQPSSDSEPPDALRAFREWVLKLSSSSDLTVKGANSLLHTLDMLLEKDLLRCGPDSNPESRPSCGPLRKAVFVKAGEGRFTREHIVYWRNVIDVIRELMGNPAFKRFMRYASERHWTTLARRARVYGEMRTRDWWWRRQKFLGNLMGTIAPLIITTDRTQMTKLSGNKLHTQFT
ncbi:hypothetical protein FRC09_020053 [Ceratobasidium sp. 395]|nr:hypothetical protein FRC09_020053 [Ceratobasidium sp. 395]